MNSRCVVLNKHTLSLLFESCPSLKEMLAYIFWISKVAVCRGNLENVTFFLGISPKMT